MSMTAGAADTATFGFRADTSQLTAADALLEKMAKTAEASATAIEKWEARANAAFAKINPSMLSGAGPAVAAAAASTAGVAAATTAQAGLAAATGTASHAITGQNAALHAGAAAHKAHGAAAYGNRLQMMELAHVGRSLFDEWAAGGSIVRGLAMEFGRLQIAVTSGEGGIGGLLGRLGSGLSRLATPAVGATASIVALGAASIYAFSRYEEGQDALERSLNGIGRRSGATLGQLQGVATQGAVAGRLSIGEATDLTGRFTAAGITPDVTGSLLGTARDYGRVTGTSTSDAGTALAAAMRDPVKGLADLDKNLGFVDDRLQQQVQDLERSGHMAAAQAAATEGLRKALEGTTDTTWGVTRAFSDAKDWLSNRFHDAGGGIAGVFGYDSPQEQLKRLQASLPNLNNGPLSFGLGRADNAQAEIDRLKRVVAGQDAQAAVNQRDARAISLSTQAGDAVRSVLPDIARARSATETLDILRQGMADPAIMAHMDAGTSQLLGRAYSNAAVVQGMSAPGLRQNQDYELRLASNDAFSTGEKGVIDARRAELEILRQTGDVLHAARSAQEALNLAIDKRNRDAADELDVAKDQRSLIGLTGLQRRLEELRLKFEGVGGVYGRDEVEHSSALNDPTIRKDFTEAAKWTSSVSSFTTALDSASTRLAAFPGTASSPYGAGPRPMTGGTTVAAGAAAFNAAPAEIQSMIRDAAARTGMDPNVIAAIGQKENSYRLTGGTSMLGANGKRSSAWGYGQLTNGAASDVARAVPGFNKFDPSTAVFGSAEYLKILADRNHGDVHSALNAYGETADYAADIARRAGGGIAMPAGVSGPPVMTIHPSLAPVAPIASTALRSDHARYDVLADTMRQDTVEQLFKGANTARDSQNASMATSIQTYGQSAAAIKGAADAQQLWNRLAADGLGPTGALSEQTGKLADRTRAYGASVTTSAEGLEAEMRLKKQIQDLEDTTRSGFSGSLSSGIVAAAHGKSFGDAFKSGMAGLGDQLIGKGTSMITGGLLGQPGQGLGTGLLGGLVSGLPHFAGGTSDAPGGLAVVGEKGEEVVNLPAHSQVISNSALGGAMKGGGGHTFNFGGATFVASGQGAFSDQQMAVLASQHAETQQKVADHIVRNLPQMQSDASQFS